MRSLPLLLAGLALLACETPEASPRREDPTLVAEVNGTPIRAGVVREALAHHRQQHGTTAFRSEEELAEVRSHLLEAYIDELLLLQAAEKHEVTITDDELERAVLSRRSAYPGHTFESTLADQGVAPSSFRKSLEHRLIIKKFLEAEVDARVAVTDADIDSWVEAHPESLEIPEQVRALQIVVRTREEAEKILGEVGRSGKDFEVFARRHSVAPEGAQGGDLGWFGRGDMPAPIDQTCFDLAPGRVSQVVESPYGYHLFKVLEHRKAHTAELDADRRAEIEADLLREKQQAAQEAYRNRLRLSADIQLYPKRLAEVR